MPRILSYLLRYSYTVCRVFYYEVERELIKEPNNRQTRIKNRQIDKQTIRQTNKKKKKPTDINKLKSLKVNGI